MNYLFKDGQMNIASGVLKGTYEAPTFTLVSNNHHKINIKMKAIKNWKIGLGILLIVSLGFVTAQHLVGKSLRFTERLEYGTALKHINFKHKNFLT